MPTYPNRYRNNNSNYRNNNGNRPHMNRTDSGIEHIQKVTPAMAYVPDQDFDNVYDAFKGLSRATIFSDLDKPFTGRGGVCHE